MFNILKKQFLPELIFNSKEFNLFFFIWDLEIVEPGPFQFVSQGSLEESICSVSSSGSWSAVLIICLLLTQGRTALCSALFMIQLNGNNKSPLYNSLHCHVSVQVDITDQWTEWWVLEFPNPLLVIKQNGGWDYHSEKTVLHLAKPNL